MSWPVAAALLWSLLCCAPAGARSEHGVLEAVLEHGEKKVRERRVELDETSGFKVEFTLGKDRFIQAQMGKGREMRGKLVTVTVKITAAQGGWAAADAAEEEWSVADVKGKDSRQVRGDDFPPFSPQEVGAGQTSGAPFRFGEPGEAVEYLFNASERRWTSAQEHWTLNLRSGHVWELTTAGGVVAAQLSTTVQQQSHEGLGAGIAALALQPATERRLFFENPDWVPEGSGWTPASRRYFLALWTVFFVVAALVLIGPCVFVAVCYCRWRAGAGGGFYGPGGGFYGPGGGCYDPGGGSDGSGGGCNDSGGGCDGPGGGCYGPGGGCDGPGSGCYDPHHGAELAVLVKEGSCQTWG